MYLFSKRKHSFPEGSIHFSKFIFMLYWSIVDEQCRVRACSFFKTSAALQCSLSKWSASFQGVGLEEPEAVTAIPREKV